MRIKVTIDAMYMTIPRNYQHLLQGIIYHSFPAEAGNELHSHDSYKYFNFSSIQGQFTSADKLITFSGEATFCVSSPNRELILALVDKWSKDGSLSFYNYKAPIKMIEEVIFDITDDKMYFDCLSPITIHKTNEYGKTIYYNPNDKEYFELINENFITKNDIDSFNVLKFSNISNVRKVILNYKGFIIEAYNFSGVIEAKNKYLKLVFEEGLGARNSAGLGMIRPLIK